MIGSPRLKLCLILWLTACQWHFLLENIIYRLLWLTYSGWVTSIKESNYSSHFMTRKWYATHHLFAKISSLICDIPLWTDSKWQSTSSATGTNHISCTDQQRVSEFTYLIVSHLMTNRVWTSLHNLLLKISNHIQIHHNLLRLQWKWSGWHSAFPDSSDSYDE
jgi:hypothetical protein